jgi:DNA ligase (NAD+)
LFDLAKILQVNPGKLGPSLDRRCQTISTSPAYRDLSDEEKARLAELQRAALGTAELDPSRDFYGKKVVLTGALQSMTRNQAKAVLESVGAIVTDSVSKTTSYVIQGEQKAEEIEAGGSRKEKQAAKLLSEGVDIEVIQEQDFHKLLLD